MNICHEHWDMIRAAIDARGLTPFIAKDGKTAAYQLLKQVIRGEAGKDTFDPLMSAFSAICGNSMQFIHGGGGNPLYCIMPDDQLIDHDRYGEQYEGRAWPHCPICLLNLMHGMSCDRPECDLDKKRGYDWMIERAADDTLEKAREYGLVA